MALPRVVITKNTGTLGGTVRAEDGVSLLVVSAPAAYTYTATVFRSLADAEAGGITEAKDLTNDALLWEHIKDFYAAAPNGTELHLLVLAPETTLVQLFTPANANAVLLRDYLAGQAGRIRLLAVGLNPSYAESHTTSVSADLLAAIPLANTFAAAEFALQRPIEVLLEGRRYAGTATAASDLSALNAGSVSVVIARDRARKAVLVTAGNSGAANYAAVGLTLGAIAAVHVGRNIGRHLNGALRVQEAEMSGGQIPYDDLSQTDLDTLYDKAYIFFTRQTGLDGWYFNDDRTCTRAINTNAHISLNRVINKACRIILAEYALRLKDEYPVDPDTGQLKPSVVAALETALQDAIRVEMYENPNRSRAKEISGARVQIDPTQNVLATGEVIADVSLVPLFIGRTLTARVSLTNPATA